MKKKVLVYRKPLLTNQKELKSNLLRVVKTTLGEVSIDVNQSISGRGVYIRYDLDTFMTIYNKRLIDKALRCHVAEEIYIEIKNLLSK